MSGCHPGTVAPLVAERVFPEQNAEALGYPSGVGSSPFGTVSVGTHWQALMCSRLSWLSSSRPPFVGRSPGLQFSARSPLSREWEVPTPAGSCEQLFKSSPRPPDGILTRFDPPRPSPPSRAKKAFPCRPRSRGKHIHRIERPVCPHVIGFHAVFTRTSLRRAGRTPLGVSSSTGPWALSGRVMSSVALREAVDKAASARVQCPRLDDVRPTREKAPRTARGVRSPTRIRS